MGIRRISIFLKHFRLSVFEQVIRCVPIFIASACNVHYTFSALTVNSKMQLSTDP